MLKPIFRPLRAANKNSLKKIYAICIDHASCVEASNIMPIVVIDKI